MSWKDLFQKSRLGSTKPQSCRKTKKLLHCFWTTLTTSLTNLNWPHTSKKSRRLTQRKSKGPSTICGSWSSTQSKARMSCCVRCYSKRITSCWRLCKNLEATKMHNASHYGWKRLRLSTARKASSRKTSSTDCIFHWVMYGLTFKQITASLSKWKNVSFPSKYKTSLQICSRDF